MSELKGCIYLLYFDGEVNKGYIGQTKRELKHRVFQHKWLSTTKKSDKDKWIFKNGRDNIKIKKLYEGKDLDNQEVKFIKEYKDNGFYLYNKTIGGSNKGTLGYKHTEKECLRRSLNNWQIDEKVYEFYNRNGGYFKGTRVEFQHKYNLKSSNIGRVVRKERLTYKGWYIDGCRNINGNRVAVNKQKYRFAKDGILEYCTIYHLRKKYGLSDSHIWRVLKGDRNHHKGWRLDYV